MLALVPILALLALEMAGDAIRQPLHRMATAVIGVGDAPDSQVAQAAEPSKPIARPQGDEKPQGIVQYWRPLLIVIAGGVLCIGLALVRQRRRRDQEHQANADPAELAQPDPAEYLFAKRQHILRLLSHNTTAIFTSQLQVRHVMTSEPMVVPLDAKIDALRKQTADLGLRHILVSDPAGRLMGVISDRDLIGRSGRTAAEIMTPNPLFVSPDAPLAPTLTLLLSRKISCLPVLEGERIFGIMTTSDILMAMQGILHVLQQIGAAAQGEFDAEEQLECTLQLLACVANEMEGSPPAVAGGTRSKGLAVQ